LAEINSVCSFGYQLSAGFHEYTYIFALYAFCVFDTCVYSGEVSDAGATMCHKLQPQPSNKVCVCIYSLNIYKGCDSQLHALSVNLPDHDSMRADNHLDVSITARIAAHRYIVTESKHIQANAAI
jgi:hypothetical protein